MPKLLIAGQDLAATDSSRHKYKDKVSVLKLNYCIYAYCCQWQLDPDLLSTIWALEVA